MSVTTKSSLSRAAILDKVLLIVNTKGRVVCREIPLVSQWSATHVKSVWIEVARFFKNIAVSTTRRNRKGRAE